MKNWPWYGQLVGAVFSNHPQGPFSTNPPCEPCFPGDAEVEDHSHPATSHLDTRWSIHDEFHNYGTNPRANVHVLMHLDESSYKEDLNLIKTGRRATGYNGLIGRSPDLAVPELRGRTIVVPGPRPQPRAVLRPGLPEGAELEASRPRPGSLTPTAPVTRKSAT